MSGSQKMSISTKNSILSLAHEVSEVEYNF